MKIAVVGCGAVGSFYGAKLCRDGQEVHFLLRSDHDAVRRRGVFIRSREGDFNARPRCARTPDEIGVSDLVLIGLKTTANERFADLLPPLVGPNTAVLTLQNGLGNEEQLAKLFRVEQILGGLCFVCLNRIEPGVIQHLDHGTIVLGEFQRWPEPRTHDIASMFRHAGVNCKVSDNLAQAHWEKLVWNIPFNGLGVASAAGYEALGSGADIPVCQFTGLSSPGSERATGKSPEPADRNVCPTRVIAPCLTTAELLADARWTALVRELMLEVIRGGNAFGFSIPESLADRQIERTRTMGAYKASTVIDFERGQPLELESLFLEPLRQARSKNVSVPRLEALCRVLQQLDAATR